MGKGEGEEEVGTNEFRRLHNISQHFRFTDCDCDRVVIAMISTEFSNLRTWGKKIIRSTWKQLKLPHFDSNYHQ